MPLALAALLALAATLTSCAYYNTFYLARKYYFKATDGAPYDVDHQTTGQESNYTKAIDYSKKVIAQYPKSKWVDDAVLLWAQALVGRDDPLQTVTLLQDFADRFPKSDQRNDAQFFLALAYRYARRYTLSVDAFDRFFQQAPKSPLVPYAYLERSRALMSLDRYSEAVDDASQILTRFPRSPLVDRALRQRAEARLEEGDYDGARADFHEIGNRATTDADRLTFLMREADCLEAARNYEGELGLLRGELGHTPPPPPPPTTTSLPASGGGIGTGTAAPPPAVPSQFAAGSDKYGRLTMRIGTAELLAGHLNEALAEYDHVMHDYPKSSLSAEAQFRIGYAYETAGDDFDRALEEYARVKGEYGTTQYTQQAQQRSDDLSRIQQFRKGTGADSLERKAEAGFLTAERYLFELKRPDRAYEEYGNVAQSYPGTSVAARALNAQAWVLERKLDRRDSADSLFWKVVREYPATEAQIAARDYLEADGQTVPDSLIVLPAPPPPDTTRKLTPIPRQTPVLGAAPRDSLRARRIGPPPGRFAPGMLQTDSTQRAVPPPVFGSPEDSLARLRRAGGGSPSSPSASPPPPAAPTYGPAPAPPDTSKRGGSAGAPPASAAPPPAAPTYGPAPAPPDTSKRGGSASPAPAPPDTSKHGGP
ncbi:MAG TPA: tetratricopeptide repeat protein [Candidatus Acidoferrales bacterium]|nr:tetratricopeptide repeat protein [Candidatus Acidoferrales bacterium]